MNNPFKLRRSRMPVDIRRTLMPMLTNNKEFGALCDDVDPFICDRQTLQELIDDAPGEYEMGFLSGVYQYRDQAAILTNIDF